MRLTAKERVLLHLLDSGRSAEEAEVPLELAQEGVARGAGIEVRHLAQFVRPLIEAGLVRERQAHVTGVRQRRKVYALTPHGRAVAMRLREKVANQTIRVRDGDAVREGSLYEVLRSPGTKTTLLETVRQVQEFGIVDLESVRHLPEPGFVEQFGDAPLVTTFVGRRDELAAITREDGGPRIFVIRGIAGIGKSTLAAKVLAMARGQRNLFWHRIRPWESDSMLLASVGRFLEALDRPGLSSTLRRGELRLAAEVLRQDLPDTRALLVLDDAHDASPQTMVVIRMIAEAVASAADVKLLVLTRRALSFYDIRDVVLKGAVREIELGGLRPEEVTAFLAEDGDLTDLLGLARRLGGHPLLVELVRKRRSDIPGAIRDVHRFIEEAVYRELSETERTIMKAASLYRVPVPRTSLLSVPGSSYEALMALQESSLMRFTGGDRYEVHDTIRDFFDTTLTVEERRLFTPPAVVDLRSLGAQAAASGDDIASIAFLSNALRISESSEERRGLWESLGDADRRIGDLASMSMAYREALKLADDRVSSARLHRKLASALVDRGYMAAAMEEVKAGLAALDGLVDLEDGWLNLARARIVKEDFAWDEAERYAESARETFVRFDNLAGEALALLESGFDAAWTGTASEEGKPVSEHRLQMALDLAQTMHDSILEARIHLAMATVIGYGSGDYETGMTHFRAVESNPAGMADPQVGPTLHEQRAWFVLRTKRDLLAAEYDLSEARRIASRVHNAGALAGLNYQAAVIAAERGLYDEAGRLDEGAGLELKRTGFGAFAADAYFSAGIYYLVAGNWDGYQRISIALSAPELALFTRNPHEKPAVHGALDALLRGDVDGFERAFAVILHAQDPFPAYSLGRTAGAWWSHLYYSVGLRALGRKHEAEEHRQRALEMARVAKNAQAVGCIECDFGNRIATTIRRRMKTA